MTNPVSFSLEKNPFFQNFDSHEMENISSDGAFINDDSDSLNVDRFELNQTLSDRLDQLAGNSPQNLEPSAIEINTPPVNSEPPTPVEMVAPVTEEVAKEAEQTIKVPSPEDLNVMFMAYGMETVQPVQQQKPQSANNNGIFSGFKNTNYSLDTFGI